MLQTQENKPSKSEYVIYTILSPILVTCKKDRTLRCFQRSFFHFFVGEKEGGRHKGVRITAARADLYRKLTSFGGRKAMPLAINLVTPHFYEYLERELGLFSVVKRRLVVTQYLPKVISRAVMKMRAKLLLAVPDRKTRGKPLNFGCGLSAWTLGRKPFARRAAQHWDRLSREATASLPLKVFNIWLDKATHNQPMTWC